MLMEAETWVALAFVLFVGVLGYLGVHRMITKSLDDRAARIKAGFGAADIAIGQRRPAVDIVGGRSGLRAEFKRLGRAILGRRRAAAFISGPAATTEADRSGRIVMVHSDLDWKDHVAKTLAAVKALKR